MFALELLNILFYNCVYISWYLRESEDGIDLCHINPSAMRYERLGICDLTKAPQIQIYPQTFVHDCS